MSQAANEFERPLRAAMVGGGSGAFIGAVHRKAMALDGMYTLVAGALSSTPEKSIASARALALASDRGYPTWQAMIEGESKRSAGERAQVVCIVTPNDTHYAIAKACVQAGFNVICDKPLCHTSEQADELVALTGKHGVVFGVTYNYSGYPMVKQARHLVQSGQLGAIRKVIVEYNQGWLASALEKSGQKQANWRTDPSRSGAGGAIGDIGSHCEQLVSYVTGLEIEALCADLTSFVPGRRLDDDANVLLRFKAANTNAAAKGILTASQIEIGHENDLRLRVWGEKAGLEWHQESPDTLLFKPDGQPTQVMRRGNAYLCDAAKKSTRLPPGHPEAFLEAFANVYLAAAEAIRAKSRGELSVPLAAGECFDFPDVQHGARGVRFIERVVESSQSERKWTRF